MKDIFKSVYLISAVLIAFGTVNAQTVVKQVPPKPTVAVDGKTLYREYCAVCHGPNGKGSGPAAAALKTAPPDLTRMAQRNNGRFPEDQVLQSLQEGGSTTAHGSHDMPIWGSIFNNMNSNPGMAQTRVHAVLQYLEQIQVK